MTERIWSKTDKQGNETAFALIDLPPPPGPNLQLYLDLERLVLREEARGLEANTVEDALRDVMDDVWMVLTSDEVEMLNARGMLSGGSGG